MPVILVFKTAEAEAEFVRGVQEGVVKSDCLADLASVRPISVEADAIVGSWDMSRAVMPDPEPG